MTYPLPLEVLGEIAAYGLAGLGAAVLVWLRARRERRRVITSRHAAALDELRRG